MSQSPKSECCGTGDRVNERHGDTRCCGNDERPAADQSSSTTRHWVLSSLRTPIGDIPVVSTHLAWADHLGASKARWRIGRMRYRVEPGLYAVGTPGPAAPVLVSANYKMSFDRLRSSVDGRDAWLLVLDTKGINVWCAAGKGTFGTDELVSRIEAVKLHDVVSTRTLILPQLGAPGVAAHEVKQRTGFRVLYGPVS
ncbi:MAG: acetyl-CoA synthase subunit gamma, partial [Planctomycetes bacterium]|nr:acetyl-CoA synthase subunit gamma [Planctomycetota bacterium]